MFGSGVLKGLAVTLREFLATYIDDIKQIPSRYSGGKEFIDRLEGHFRSAGIATKRYAKPTNTKVAPTALLQQIAAEAQLAVIALSD